MGKLVSFIFLFLQTIFLQAQFTNESVIAKQVVDAAVDNLQNLYLISPKGQIKKLNQKLDSVAVFNNIRQYGTIASIDVSNPLKIVVFYKNFSTILVLDRFLNVKATLDLRKQNILQASAVALSFDNFFWIYDELENKLKKLNDNGELVFESTDLRLVFNEIKPIEKIIDSEGKLYLYNKHQGLMLFDYYGAFKKKFAFLGYQNLFIKDKECIGIKDSIVEINDLNNFSSSTQELNFLKGSSKILFYESQVYYIKNQELCKTKFK